MLYSNDPSFSAYYDYYFPSTSKDQAAIMEPLVDLLIDIYFPQKGGALVKYQPQDDNLEETVSRIEDRIMFFNDTFSSVIAELQELQAWVNNLDSESDSLDNQNPQIFSWASEEDEIDAFENVRSWFASQAKSEKEGSTLPVIDESQLNDWVNKHSEVDSLVNTSLHYQVQYGGKLQSVATLVEGRWQCSWSLTSGGTSYKSPYNFHSCLSKQPKKTPCSAT